MNDVEFVAEMQRAIDEYRYSLVNMLIKAKGGDVPMIKSDDCYINALWREIELLVKFKQEHDGKVAAKYDDADQSILNPVDVLIGENKINSRNIVFMKGDVHTDRHT